MKVVNAVAGFLFGRGHLQNLSRVAVMFNRYPRPVGHLYLHMALINCTNDQGSQELFCCYCLGPAFNAILGYDDRPRFCGQERLQRSPSV